MRYVLRGSVLLLLLLVAAGSAHAQVKPAAKKDGKPAARELTWSDLTGDWVGRSMRGKSDSVITRVTTTFGADKKVWVKFPNRPPVAATLVTMGGDSVVIETEKYPSITRPGHTSSVRMTNHVRKHKMTGTFRATFDDGKTLDGHSVASHKVK